MRSCHRQVGWTLLSVAARPKFERLAVNDFAERSAFNSSPAIAGSRLYVRSDRFLYCLGTK